MYNSPESWAIHLRNLRAVWWSQCQVPCLHLRDFRPDLGQKMVDAIVSCLPKNTESTITILRYRHLGLAAIPAAVFQNGGCLCSETTSTQKHRHDEKASYSRQGVPGEEFFPLSWFISTSSSENLRVACAGFVSVPRCMTRFNKKSGLEDPPQIGSLRKFPPFFK